MRCHQAISIPFLTFVMFATVGCDDQSASQPSDARSKDMAPAASLQQSAENVRLTSPSADIEDVAREDAPAEATTPNNTEGADADSDNEPETSRPTRRPFRRPPPPGETAPPPQPRVVRTTRAAASGGVTEITFDTIKFDIEPGDPFTPDMLPEEIEKLFGKRVRIRGYIYPPFQQSGIKQFVLVRDNMECCFGPGAAL